MRRIDSSRLAATTAGGLLAAITLVVSLTACGSDSEPSAATSPPATAPSPTSTGSTAPVEVEASQPPKTDAEEAAWTVYDPDPFRGLPMSGYLYGDDFVGGPFTEAIDLCGTVIAPASTPVVPRVAMAYTGGGLSASDNGPVTRGVALYHSAADARTTYDALASAVTTCRDGVRALTVPGAVAWSMTGTNAGASPTPGTTTTTEVWIASIDGLALLIQHEPVTASTATAQQKVANELLTSARGLRVKLAEKVAPSTKAD